MEVKLEESNEDDEFSIIDVCSLPTADDFAPVARIEIENDGESPSLTQIKRKRLDIPGGSRSDKGLSTITKRLVHFLKEAKELEIDIRARDAAEYLACDVRRVNEVVYMLEGVNLARRQDNHIYLVGATGDALDGEN